MNRQEITLHVQIVSSPTDDPDNPYAVSLLRVVRVVKANKADIVAALTGVGFSTEAAEEQASLFITSPNGITVTYQAALEPEA